MAWYLSKINNKTFNFIETVEQVFTRKEIDLKLTTEIRRQNPQAQLLSNM